MVTPTSPAAAIVATVRAAQSAFSPSPDDTPYDRAKRATAAIAEAGLRLRGALVPELTAGDVWTADAADIAVFDAAVRAACGEGV